MRRRSYGTDTTVGGVRVDAAGRVHGAPIADAVGALADELEHVRGALRNAEREREAWRLAAVDDAGLRDALAHALVGRDPAVRTVDGVEVAGRDAISELPPRSVIAACVPGCLACDGGFCEHCGAHYSGWVTAAR